jgi:NifB/MoaA-like Fe-S oxidoreductase
MTVTGLLTGQDVLQGLQEKPLGDAVLLPSLMLKYGTTQFLDDMTVAQLSTALNIPIVPIQGGAEDLVQTCLLL